MRGPSIRSVVRPVVRVPLRGMVAGSGGGFQGILDALATAPVGAWSMARRLTGAYDGALIRLRRNDAATSDFGFDDEGLLDTTAIATWIGGGSATVAIVYDQAGDGRNLAQATAGDQPPYTASGMNGRPGYAATGAKRLTATDEAFDDLHNTGMTVHAAFRPSATDSSTNVYKGDFYGVGWGIEGYGPLSFYLRGSGAPIFLPSPSLTGPNVDHVCTIAYDGETGCFYRHNGEALTVNNAGGTTHPLPSDAGHPLQLPGNNSMPGNYSELILFAAPLSLGDLQALNDDASAFYVAA